MRNIVVDSSAIFAIILDEEDGPDFRRVLGNARPIMSAATRIEVAQVALRRFGSAGISEAEGVLADYGVRTVPLDEDQSVAAISALIAYGIGRGAPPAVLNLGDAFSYALAKMRGLPLLYKGNDFAQTDIRSALDPEKEPAP